MSSVHFQALRRSSSTRIIRSIPAQNRTTINASSCISCIIISMCAVAGPLDDGEG